MAEVRNFCSTTLSHIPPPYLEVNGTLRLSQALVQNKLNTEKKRRILMLYFPNSLIREEKFKSHHCIDQALLFMGWSE